MGETISTCVNAGERKIRKGEEGTKRAKGRAWRKRERTRGELGVRWKTTKNTKAIEENKIKKEQKRARKSPERPAKCKASV